MHAESTIPARFDPRTGTIFTNPRHFNFVLESWPHIFNAATDSEIATLTGRDMVVSFTSEVE